MEKYEGWFTCVKPTKDSIELNREDCKSIDNLSLMSCKGSAFSYGYKGMAKHQLKSLAALSSTALQSVHYNCMRGSSAMRTIGWNGAEFSVRESEWKLMQNIEVESNCENSDMSDQYTVYTSVPESLPFADIEGKLSSSGAKIQLGEVCFA
jgi:hypothetical protein